MRLARAYVQWVLRMTTNRFHDAAIYAVFFAIGSLFVWLFGQALSNEEIVKQARFCESNGMAYAIHYSGFDYPTAVFCVPKERK